MLEDYVMEFNKGHEKENDECINKSEIGKINKDLGAVFQNIKVKLQNGKLMKMFNRMKKEGVKQKEQKEQKRLKKESRNSHRVNRKH